MQEIWLVYAQKQNNIKFKSVSQKITIEMQQHCYFHKSEYIQHFCALKQCTLPLCQQCLQIHEDQHKQKSQEPKIIPYRQAYEQVFGSLSLFIQNNKQPLETLADQVKRDKEEAVKMVDNYFKDVEGKINSEYKLLSEVEQKFEKLKKGSIKTVIYYYSGEISLKPLQLPEFKQIQSCLKQFMRNIHEEKKEEIQTFRQKRNSQPQWSESKIQPYQPRPQQTHSRKKSIFQNQKSKVNLHKNNQPYLDNRVVVAEQIKKQELQRNCYENHQRQPYENYQRQSYENYQRQQPYEIYQRQANPRVDQKSQVDNFFHHYKAQSANKRGETNTHSGEMKSFKIQSKTLRNFEIESHLGIQPVQNSFRPLKETPYAINQQHRQTRPKTLDKFPSMVDLKKTKDNLALVQHNEEEFPRFDKPNYWQNKVTKWNKNHQEKENNRNFDQQPSVFSQLTINDTTNGMSTTQFTNRRPLKTTDLETYTPLSNNKKSFEGRQRTASYQAGGLRTTVSHNNLYAAGKKAQPLLGDELKKQVLSPHEIRKMLEKKIEQRNKVLTQKKELQLKINPDRQGQATTMGSATRVGTQAGYIKEKGKEMRQGQQMKYDENTNANWGQVEQKQSMYNTKDSIINHIYRETRY